jgi:hypothetical protein|tara:strand:+ start:563 stop:751 length:189 start_codon:yes stop_codon:yes gene_type:complete
MNYLQERIKDYGQQRLSVDASVNKSDVSQVMTGGLEGFSKKAGYRVSKVLKVKLAICQGLEK